MPDETTTTDAAATAPAATIETPSVTDDRAAELKAAHDKGAAEARLALKADKARMAELEKAAAELADLKAAQLTEVEKAQAAAAEAEAKAAKAEATIAALKRDALVSKVASEKGVPAAALPFVRFDGETEEEIAVSVDAYLAAVPAVATTTGTGTTPGAVKTGDLEQRIAEATARGDATALIMLEMERAQGGR